MNRVAPFLAVLLFLTGCGWLIPYQARVNHHHAQVLQEWRKDHPDAKLTDEIKAQLLALAEDRARGEETQEREEAIEKATDAASKFSRGDIVGGVLGTIGLTLLGVGAVKKRKQMKEAPTIDQQLAADDAEYRRRIERAATARPDDPNPPPGAIPGDAPAAGEGSPT